MFRFIKRLFPRIFYVIDNEVLYKTIDGLYIAYKDKTLEIVMDRSSYVIDMGGVEDNSVSVMKVVDPFLIILDLDTEFLESLRVKYEEDEEFDVCNFIDRELMRREKLNVGTSI